MPKQPWLHAARGTPFFVNNLKLLSAALDGARVYVRRSLGAAFRAEAERRGCAASLLFYQSIASYALLDKESGLKSMDNLLRGDKASPAAIRRAGPTDARRPGRTQRRDAGPRRPANGRYPPAARPGPGRKESRHHRGRRHQVAGQDHRRTREATTGRRRGRAAAKARQVAQVQPAHERLDDRPGQGAGNVASKHIGEGSGWATCRQRSATSAMQAWAAISPAVWAIIEAYYRRLAAEEGPMGDRGEGSGKSADTQESRMGRQLIIQ